MRILLLITGMTVVTYIPRALPFVLIDKIRPTKKLEKFLNLIPYTVMSALIFPGILSVDKTMPAVGIIGGLTAAVLAWCKFPVGIVIAGGVLADVIFYTLS